MTIVVVNAISIREGGSLVVLRELLGGMAAYRPQWHWHVVVNNAVKSSLLDLPNVEYLRFPKVDQSGVRTRLWYETGLPRLLKGVSADVLFSMTNYLPMRRMPCHTLLLVQHAGHFSPAFRQLTEERLGLLGRVAWRLKGSWVKSSVRRADIVTVQTHALAHQIAHETGLSPDRFRVVPHGVGLANLQARPTASPAQGEKIRIGYIAKYGVQKNFNVLFDAIALLRERGVPLSLVLTLSETQQESKEVLQAAKDKGVADLIENLGERPADEIDKVFGTLHALVFPSICESFGFPMVEAMAHGVPLLVSDTDSNIEVAGAGAVVFPAHDAELLANELERLSHDAEWFQLRAQASLQRARDFDWTRVAVETVSLVDELVGRRRLGGTAITAPFEGRCR